jgi:hypothetical protein
MIAFRVEIDGEAVTTAGSADWSLLGVHVTASRGDPAAPVATARSDDVKYSLGGLSEPDSAGIAHHFRWGDRQLSLGSKITVTVVDVETVDPPIKRYRSDAKVQENPFTEEEWRDLRYQDYLQLKREFEGNDEAPPTENASGSSP